MTDIWFDEQDSSADYIPQHTLFRCIDAERQWDAQINLEESYCQLAELELAVDQLCREHTETHTLIDALLDAFYTRWLFSGSNQSEVEYKLNSVNHVLKMRTGNATSLALILTHLLQRAQLDVNMAFNQGDLMVHIALSAEEGYIVEPCGGNQTWYINAENDKKAEEPYELLFGDEAFKLYLAQQKWAFITADKFGHALSCVEQLMDLLGDDPYERRDRGYLLNQINCPKLAKADLQFFVDECPDDPTIEIIQHQIEELQDYNHVVH